MVDLAERRRGQQCCGHVIFFAPQPSIQIVDAAFFEAKSKSKISQQVLILRLRKQDYNLSEAKALVQMGSACEEMLLKAYAKLPEIKFHLPAILEQVGTEKSISVMERLELDCHKDYDRNKIHASRVKMLNRLKLTGSSAGAKTGDVASPATSKLKALFGD